MRQKSCVEYLLGLYCAMFDDIARSCPYLRIDCERDYSRLLSIIEKQGIRYFLIDLPSMGRHFDQCLAQGRLIPSNLPFSRPFRRNGLIPRHYKGLYLSVFDESGVLRIDYDPLAVKFLRQIFFCAKRFRLQCPDSSTWEQVNEFYQVDKGIRSPSLSWDDDRISTDNLRDLTLCDRIGPVLSGSDLFPETVAEPSSISCDHVRTIQSVGDVVAATLGRFDPLEWRPRHGPGAVADLYKESKYGFPYWPAKLEGIFPMSAFAFANYGHWIDYLRSSECGSKTRFSSSEPPSKLIAVPKTLEAPRLIASEPTSHLWCQQIIRDFLMKSVSRLPIAPSVNFSSQEANGILALAASHTESHVTIDLSAASDRISCWLVERIFRANSSLIEALHAVRTRWISNRVDRKSPAFHRLRKFTTMGSAVTFPVQTYVFCIIAVGSVLYARGLRPTMRNIRNMSREVRVFGDDIIVPKDAWPATQEALGYLGLQINPRKTFYTGRFRESCGVEAYNGDDVTKVSVLASPEVSRPGSIVSAVDSHNNFYERGYYSIAAYIKSTVLKEKQLQFPEVTVGSGVLGWANLLGQDFSSLRRRWNSHLQRLEYLVTSCVSKEQKVPIEGNQMMLQYFTEVSKPPISKEVRLGFSSESSLKLKRRWVEAVTP